MGFSPLEGLVMGSRSGDLDPAVVPYLQKRLGKDCAEIVGLLNRESGVAGLSGGVSNLSQLAARSCPTITIHARPVLLPGPPSTSVLTLRSWAAAMVLSSVAESASTFRRSDSVSLQVSAGLASK